MYDIKKQFRFFLLSPERIFVSLALFFGIGAAFLMPQLSVNDEGAHFLRTYNLASGHLGRANCSYPEQIFNKVLASDQGHYSTDFNKKIDFNKIYHPARNACGSASSYSPLMHLPQMVGVFVAKIIYPSAALMVLFGRLTNLLFYAISLYLIIKTSPIAKWTLVVIGLIPLFIQNAGSLSADVMNTVVILGFIVCVFNLFLEKTKRYTKNQLFALFIFTICLGLTKLPNLVLLLPLIFVKSSAFPKNPLSLQRLPFNIYKWGLGFIMVIAALAVVVLWQIIYGHSLVVNPPDNPLNARPWHFIRILYNTYLNPAIGYENVVFDGIIGTFSFKYYLPNYMTYLSWGLVLFTLLVECKGAVQEKLYSINKLAFACIISGIALIFAITYAMYTAWAIQPFRLGPGAPYADGVQGRYFTALIALLIPAGIYLRRYINIQVRRPEITGFVVLLFTTFQLTFYIVETYFFAIS